MFWGILLYVMSADIAKSGVDATRAGVQIAGDGIAAYSCAIPAAPCVGIEIQLVTGELSRVIWMCHLIK